MKKLYLIGTILRDWFTHRTPVTFTVTVVFVLSFIVVPYSFLNECMKDQLDPELSGNLMFNEAYRQKPENNEYIPYDTDIPVHFNGITHFGDERVYPAYVRLMFSSFMFESRLNDDQKASLAAFLGISPDGFTNSYDIFYHEQVSAFKDRAFKECLIAAVFCILNVMMIISFLGSSNVKALTDDYLYLMTADLTNEDFDRMSANLLIGALVLLLTLIGFAANNILTVKKNLSVYRALSCVGQSKPMLTLLYISRQLLCLIAAAATVLILKLKINSYLGGTMISSGSLFMCMGVCLVLILLSAVAVVTSKLGNQFLQN